ncbi:MAG: hypothetical protein HY764_04475 [Candidatus Portnoybacteria bacterium]|nr:hypothetical protein [Candidatus Portnoybacteria bacterium]
MANKLGGAEIGDYIGVRLAGTDRQEGRLKKIIEGEDAEIILKAPGGRTFAVKIDDICGVEIIVSRHDGD